MDVATDQINVVKRDGTRQLVQFDKITKRIGDLCKERNIKCMYTSVALSTINGLFDGIKTSELDVLAAETAAYMCLRSFEYDRLASALIVSNLHKETDGFIKTSILLHESGSLTNKQLTLVAKYGDELEKHIDYNKDYDYDYSGIQSMIAVTLATVNNKVVERPQCMYMRVALAIYEDDTASVLDCYRMFADKLCIHGTPTMLNAGMNNRLASCFLLTVSPGIASEYKTLRDCAIISSTAGGIGFNISGLPAAGSPNPSGSLSSGIIPLLRVFNETLRYAEQGGGRRQGAFAAYLEPWHADIEAFINLRLPSGGHIEESRCKNLLIGIWMCDLFMERVRDGKMWSLFSPSVAPGLNECYGDEFRALYERYESEEKAQRTIDATELWLHICKNIADCGLPYILQKDACNLLSNQRHLGCIKSSNLCTEIIQYSSKEETAVCNLASVSLPSCVVDVKTQDGLGSHRLKFDHQKLFEIVRRLVINLNRVIDVCNYPTPESKVSNTRHRPIGVGVSGLTNTFIMLRIPFESPEADKLNFEIFETIYYAFMRTSCDLAEVHGKYSSYEGSYVSKGILNYMLFEGTVLSGRWPFDTLIEDIKEFGTLNSLGTCVMPTSTASIVHGNNESVEPYITNVFVRKVIAGEHIVCNRLLETELTRLGLWTPEIKNKIVSGEGSVQHIPEIPIETRELFKTVWEIGSKSLITKAGGRAPFIDQSQSLNLYMERPNKDIVSNALFYGWRLKLKTCMYYMRSKATSNSLLISQQGCGSCSV